MSNKGDVELELDKFLNSIRGRVCFTQVLRVYTPTCYGKCDEAVNELSADLARDFGGTTMYEKVQGCWVDPKDKLECEPVKVIELAHECATRDDLRKLAKAIVKYSQKANQHSIGIRNGSFYIAESKELLERHLLESLKEEAPG